MVVSVNPSANVVLFEKLLADTLKRLQEESKLKESEYLKLLGNKLENVVADIMREVAKKTIFEDSIELISGQKFPDIIAKKYFGVEVKTTKQNHWTTTGNSVLEGTRVEGIERIFLMFGKMISPIEFKCRPYEECLSEVVVTHSPRYLINMNLSVDETIFKKLGIGYDELRNSTSPIKPIASYYRKMARNGEDIWWLDSDEINSSSIIIKLWKNLSSDEKKECKATAMLLFPEIFGNSPNKFNGFAIWLINSKGIVCPNIRDIFTAGGTGKIIWNRTDYTRIPKIIIELVEYLPIIKEKLNHFDDLLLKQYWQDVKVDRYKQWVSLVVDNSSHMNLKLNLKKFLMTPDR